MPANVKMLIVQGKKKSINDQSKPLNSWWDLLLLLLSHILLQKEFSVNIRDQLKVSSSLQGFPTT